MIISGEYSHTLDAKNRIILPAKLREQLGNEVIMTKSVDCCVAIYPRDRWNDFTEKLAGMPETETRRVKRFIFSSAFETTVDSQGRILISSLLCEYAMLEKNVRVIGVGDHAEIWAEEKWAEELASEEGKEMADVLISLGF